MLGDGFRTELVVPDLSDFKLKPYVGYGAKRNEVEKVVFQQ